MDFKNCYHINSHSERCNCETLRRLNCYDEQFLFFLNNDFYIISYNSCILDYRDKYNFKIDLIKQILDGKCKEIETYKIERSYDIGRDFKNYRIRDIQFKKTTIDVNYIYYDNAGKEYGLVTRRPYLDILDKGIIDTNYKNLLEFIHKSSFDDIDKKTLREEAKELFLMNYVILPDDKEFVKTFDKLIKILKQKTNTYETSK